MNRITQLFETKKKGILSVFFTGGYPKFDDTKTVLKALQEKGIDLVEVGIPFSDPLADGKTIQDASNVALKNGMTLRKLFEQVKDARKEVTMPIILMGYLNPIMRMGFETFCKNCAETGVDGVIIPDLPFDDYIEEYKPIADKYGVKVVMLITPETSDERIRLIDEHTNGFIYMVSSASTTGAQESFDQQKQAYFERIEGMKLNNPCLIGFGISNKETFESASAHSAGAIIGSKFVQLLASEETPEKAVDALLDAISR